MATNLGIATAYGYAKSKGYTGTEDEFAQLMKNYADVEERCEGYASDAHDSEVNAADSKADAALSKNAAATSKLASEGYAVGTQNGTPVSSDSPYYHNNAEYYADQAQSAVSGKADKVSGATSGDFAGLDSNGNLTDSGKKASDFVSEPATDGTNGQVLTTDGNGGRSWETVIAGVGDVQVNGTSVVTSGTANIPVASDSTLGVAKVGTGLTINSNNELNPNAASATQLKAGTSSYRPIVPYNQHQAVFFGLSKVAGQDLASDSSVTLGTYPPASKTAIKTMLGVTDPTVTDIQVNGTSVVTSGVGNVPKADSNTLGVIKVGTGVSVDSGGSLSADNEVLVSSTQPSETGNKLWIDNSSNGNEYSVPTVAELNALSADVIHSPASPSSGDFLVYNGSAWVAQSLSTWQGGNY